MKEFWITYQDNIIWTAIVVTLVLVLRIVNKRLHHWLEQRSLKKNPDYEITTIHLTQKILNALWIVLGVMAISWNFMDEERVQEVALGSFGLVLYIGIVAVITLAAASVTGSWFMKSIRKKSIADQDTTIYKFLRYIAVFAVYFIGGLLILIAFESMCSFAATALGGAGVLAVVAGVASQEALSNPVGGPFIIAFKPFKLGDIIKVDESMAGTVTDITLLHTVRTNY